MHTHIHTYVHTYMQTCIHAYMHTYPYIHTFSKYIHNVHAYIQTYTHTYIHATALKHIVTELKHHSLYVHIYTYAHTHIHTYTQASALKHIFTEHKKSVLCAAISGDSKLIASCGIDKTIKFWRTDTAKLVSTFKSQTSFTCVDLNVDGTLLVTARDKIFQGNCISLWDIKNVWTGGKPILLQSHRQGRMSIDGTGLVNFSRDGQKAAYITQLSEGVVVWNVQSGKDLLTLESRKGNLSCMAWSHDGKRMAAGGGTIKSGDMAAEEHIVNVWDGVTGQPWMEPIIIDQRISCIALDSTGRLLVVGGYEQSTDMWLLEDIAGAVPLYRLHFDYGYPTSVCVSDTGCVIFAHYDRITMSDNVKGRLLRTFLGHTKNIKSLAWSSDGRHIVSCSIDASVRVWGLDEQVCVVGLLYINVCVCIHTLKLFSLLIHAF